MLSRLEQLKADNKDDGYLPDMPPVECGEYLLNYLFEIGPVLHGGMGGIPLTNAEIDAWQRNMSIRLSPWESRALHHLSRIYLAEHQAASDPKRSAPWKESEDVKAITRRAAVAMRDHVRGLAKL